jgi:hypothetical protein
MLDALADSFPWHFPFALVVVAGVNDPQLQLPPAAAPNLPNGNHASLTNLSAKGFGRLSGYAAKVRENSLTSNITTLMRVESD